MVQIAKGKAYTIWLLPAFQNTLWMLQQRLRGWFCTESKAVQMARGWKVVTKFKDSFGRVRRRGSRQLDHMVGCGGVGRRQVCAGCSLRRSNQPPVLSQALLRQGLLGQERAPVRRRRRSGSVLKSMEIDRLLEDLKKYKVYINR